MGIFKRITDFLVANINSTLDSVEDPIVMLEQAIRDIKDKYAMAENALIKSRTSLKTIERHADNMRERINNINDVIKSAIESDDETHAKRLLVKRKVYNDSLSMLKSSIENNQKSIQVLIDNNAKMRDQIDMLIIKKDTLVATGNSAIASKEVSKFIMGIQDDNGVSFEEYEEKIHRMQDEASALDDMSHDRVNEQEVDFDIEQELKEFKSNMK